MTKKNKTFFDQYAIHTIFELKPNSRFSTIKRLFLVIIGSLLFAINLNLFVNSSELTPGGFTGITKLIQRIFSQYLDITLPFSPIYFLCNIIPVIISFIFIGKKFTLLSCLMILLSGLFTDIISVPAITDDIMLSAIFGGLLNALAISFCLFAGATSGGTDFIAIFISERYGKDAWNYILYLNIFILGVSGILLGWKSALYSMIFQFTSTQALNYLYKRYQKITLFVITNKTEEIYQLIKSTTNHDATLFHGEGCFQKQQRDMLYSVVSADEANKITRKIKELDQNAFINIIETKQILGRFYRKPND